jgi:hypothetical protein
MGGPDSRRQELALARCLAAKKQTGWTHFMFGRAGRMYSRQRGLPPFERAASVSTLGQVCTSLQLAGVFRCPALYGGCSAANQVHVRRAIVSIGLWRLPGELSPFTVEGRSFLGRCDRQYVKARATAERQKQ